MTAELLDSLTAGSDHVIEMIGDLETGPTTTTGQEIKDCLTGEAGCQTSVSRVSLNQESIEFMSAYSLSGIRIRRARSTR